MPIALSAASALFGSPTKGRTAVINKDLLDILVCPACKTKVLLEGERLVCHNCGRKYPIRDGIPVMLIEEGDKALAEEQGK